MTLDIAAYFLKSAAGPHHGDQCEAAVCREAANCLVLADILLEIVGGKSAVVAVIARAKRRLGVVLRRADDLPYQRVHTVSADYELRPFFDCAARPAVASNSGNSIAVPYQRLHGEIFSQLRPGIHGRIHQ